MNIPHQNLYKSIKEMSIYTIKKFLTKIMVKQAIEELKPLLEKSPSTLSRAGLSISADNSVIDRCGKFLRCTWSWYSGRFKKVVKGNDLMGLVLTVGNVAIPLHLAYCSKQGRGNTDKPSLLISMLSCLKDEFAKEGIDITQFPITMDSWFVSNPLRKKIRKLGFEKIIIAGKGNYSFSIGNKNQKASEWKKDMELNEGEWGIEVPSKRVKALNKTFGEVTLFFFKKSTTRTFYLMSFGSKSQRGAEIWKVWKQHHLIECFWKTLKSVFRIKALRLHGDGLYTGLLIKAIVYIIALRLKSQKNFSNLTFTQIMRKIMREYDLKEILNGHFHSQFAYD